MFDRRVMKRRVMNRRVMMGNDDRDRGLLTVGGVLRSSRGVRWKCGVQSCFAIEKIIFW